MKKYVEKSLEELKIETLTVEEQEQIKGGYTITMIQP